MMALVAAAVLPGGMMGCGPGYNGISKGTWEIVLYTGADRMIPRYPFVPPPRFDVTEAAMAANGRLVSANVLYVGKPVIFGIIGCGKLSIKDSGDGTEVAMVVLGG